MDNISIFKTAFEEAEKTLEYSLFLPKIEPMSIPTDNLIESALYNTYQNCHLKIFNHWGYTFFGLFNSPTLVDVFQFGSTNLNSVNDVYSDDFFASSLLSQCLISAYDTIIQLLTATNKYITPYALNKLKSHGFSYLLNEEIISIPFKVSDKRTNSSLKVSVSYDEAKHMKRKSKNLISNFEDSGFNIHGITNDLNHINFYIADLIYKLSNVTSGKITNFLSLYEPDFRSRKLSKYDNLELLRYFCDILNYYIPSADKSIEIDNLYYYYKLEKMFNISLCNCAAQLIDTLKNNNHLYPDGENDLKNLALISQMPNVFSRNYYLQYALESLKVQSDIYNNNFQRILRPTIGNYFIESHPYDIFKWNQTFKQYCQLFTNFVIPAEEWYFFITIFKSLNPNATFNDTETLLTLHQLLKEYIEKNATRIIMPTKDLSTANPNRTTDTISDVTAFIENYFNEYDKLQFSKSESATEELTKLKRKTLPTLFMRYFKNEKLIDELPIPLFNKNMLLKESKANTTYNTIMNTYIKSTISNILT